MKKSLIILVSLVLAASGCMKFEHETPTARVYVDAPVIGKAIAMSETGLSVSIDVPTGTGYYSYAVLEGPAQKLDSVKLFKVAVSGAIVDGTVDGQTTPSIMVEATGLDPNSEYTVYAVSASTQGSIGKVVSKTYTTFDFTVPTIADFAFSENQVAFTFSEDVTYDQSKNVTAVGYAKLYLTGSPVIASTTGKVVSVSGPKVVVKFEEIVTPGTYYTINFPEGTFKDSANNPCPELKSRFYKDESGKTAMEGYYAYLKNASIAAVEPTLSAIKDLKEWIKVGVPTMVNGIDSKAEFTTAIYHEENGVKTTTVYPMSPITHFAGDYYNILVKPAGAPQRGDYITITIPAKACTDIYGNTNDEIVIGPVLYSFGFTLEDVVGTYQNSGESGYGASYNEDPWAMAIAASDNAEKGNVMITGYYGFTLDEPIYANFNFDLGTLTYPNYYSPITTLVEDGVAYFFYTFGYYSCQKGTKADMVLYMLESGVFSDGEDYPGYYYEAYQMPASGKIEDITDEDYLGYEYNMFFPEFNRLEAVTSSARKFNTSYLTGSKNFSRKLVK